MSTRKLTPFTRPVVTPVEERIDQAQAERTAQKFLDWPTSATVDRGECQNFARAYLDLLTERREVAAALVEGSRRLLALTKENPCQ